MKPGIPRLQQDLEKYKPSPARILRRVWETLIRKTGTTNKRFIGMRRLFAAARTFVRRWKS